LASHIINFKGAFPSDVVLDQFETPFCIVINTDPSTEDGQHWTGLVVGPVSIYFLDSYGRRFDDSSFPPIFRSTLQKIAKDKTVAFNGEVIQDIGSQACGYICLYVLHKLTLEHSIKKTFGIFSSDLKKNDRYVVQYFKDNFLNR